MEYRTIDKILDFLNDKEGKEQPKNWVEFRNSLKWKLLNNETLTKKELNVEGDLDLSYSNIKSLPKGLYVGGSLSLYDCTNLTSLPEGLYVGGLLNLGKCTSLTSLPEELEVRGDLSLWNCQSLESLPKGLKVDGILNLYNCINLKSLPKGLKVGGYLRIKDTALEELSDENLRDMIGDKGYINGKIFR